MAIVIARTFLIYASLLLTMRLLGKRQLGEMELSEFVVAASAADVAAIPLQDIGIPMINGLISIVVLFCCEVLVAGAAMKSARLRSVLYGKPSMIIDHGVINQKEMRRNRFTLDELYEELRSSGSTDISTIEYAILETDGKLSILPFSAEKPAPAKYLGVDIPDSGYTGIIINDGRVIGENLALAGHDRKWLDSELRRRGTASPSQVYLMTVNSAGEVYFCAKEGKS